MPVQVGLGEQCTCTVGLGEQCTCTSWVGRAMYLYKLVLLFQRVINSEVVLQAGS